MNYLLLGIALIAVAAGMMFVGRPRDGKVAVFLGHSTVATTYALVVTCSFALGIGALILSIGALGG